MRVNSVVTGFFTNPLRVASGIAIGMLAIFLTASSFTDHSDSTLRTKQVNLLIRQIGHRLLLQSGDATSRVLPVKESKEGTFQLSFENEFDFNHDSLMVLSERLLPKTQHPAGYTVTVHDCMKKDIVYGFQVNNSTADILACSGRTQPRGCYTIEFTFQDKIDLQQSKTTIFGSPKMSWVYGGLLILLIAIVIIWRFTRKLKPEPIQDQDHTVIKEPLQELPALGKFLIDVKGQHLLLGSEVINLTDKECKVLELLHKNFGELIPRETLMQEVWINEGVITGRSLDMFVSKLRKKLSQDPALKISNVHGKGYKLEISAS